MHKFLPHRSNKKLGLDYDEQTLIDYRIKDGYCYFVQYAAPNSKNNELRTDAINWLVSQNFLPDRDWSWVGGRFYYEFCFKDEDVAFLFKLARGV